MWWAEGRSMGISWEKASSLVEGQMDLTNAGKLISVE